MLSFISFVLVCIGCINWFSIGILQFDFVAGVFGSQSNIFSRLVYTLVGIAAIIVIANFITNRGKFVVSFNKANKEFDAYKEEKREENRKKALATESGDDLASDNNKKSTESGKDCGKDCSHDCKCGDDKKSQDK